MDVERELAAMEEQFTEQYWIIRVHRDTARLYGMYLMGILVGLFLARKGAHVR